jgi:hypothetical protein
VWIRKILTLARGLRWIAGVNASEPIRLSAIWCASRTCAMKSNAPSSRLTVTGLLAARLIRLHSQGEDQDSARSLDPVADEGSFDRRPHLRHKKRPSISLVAGRAALRTFADSAEMLHRPRTKPGTATRRR